SILPGPEPINARPQKGTDSLPGKIDLVALPGLEPGRLAARDFHTTSAFAAPEGFVVWTVPSPSRLSPP
ncbi:MAG: hypothetical protein ACREFB_03895, partial [Stellaceae bacterium]